MDSIISVKSVDLKISKTQILKDINVEFEEGKIHGLIGRNGSGKTMLMKCICGFIKPTEGVITVDGKRVGKDVDFPKDMGGLSHTIRDTKILNCLQDSTTKSAKNRFVMQCKKSGLIPT